MSLIRVKAGTPLLLERLSRSGPRRALAPRSPWLMADFFRIVIAILLPPLGVFLQVGFRGAFWLNILLTLLGYLPGIVHAVWVIARR
jgi:uncharacterized membrane protein YqaE (UPF0057 family)